METNPKILLSIIIERKEKQVKDYMEKNKAQQINQKWLDLLEEERKALYEVYDELPFFLYYDLWFDLEKEIESLLRNDSQIGQIIIIMPVRLNSKSAGYINLVNRLHE